MGKKILEMTEEELQNIAGGEEIDVSRYSEEELDRIFDLYFSMYGYSTKALPYLKDWGVTPGDFYVANNNRYFRDSPYEGAPVSYRLAHLIWLKNHR